MLISEELYLLLTTASGKQESHSFSRPYGLVGALLTDLLVAGKITLSDEKRPRVTIIDATPTGDPVLDFGLATLAKRDGRRVDNLITSTKLDPTDVVAQSLVSRGILAEGDRPFLGLGRPRMPEQDPIPETQLRARLTQVLSGVHPPTVGDATILGTLQGLGAARRVLRDESAGMSGRDLKRRIDEVMADSPTGDAVGRAVAAVTAAMMTAIMVPVITASTG